MIRVLLQAEMYFPASLDDKENNCLLVDKRFKKDLWKKRTGEFESVVSPQEPRAEKSGGI